MRTDRRELTAVFAGGFVGAIARAELAEAFPFQPGRWPWATFIANMTGALLLGYLTTRLQERLPVSAYRRPLWGTGVCGALTTFSTLQLELPQMLDGEHTGLAVAYGSVSILAGFLAVAVTTNLGSGRTALAASPFSTSPSAWPLASVRPGRADAWGCGCERGLPEADDLLRGA